MYSVAFQGIGNCEAATLSGKVTTRPPTVAWFLWIQTFLSCSKQNAWHTNLVINDMQLTTALLTSEGFPQGEWFDYHQRRKYFCLINVTCLSIIYWTLILWLVAREKLNRPRRKNLPRVPIYESKSQRAAIISKNQSTDTLWRQGFCKVTRLETFGGKQFITRSHITLK